MHSFDSIKYIIIENFRKYFLRFWVGGTIGLSILFYFTSTKIQLLPPDPTAAGFTLFVDTFIIPIYFFVGCIPIYGIILTVERMKQTEKQYNILFHNFYFQHIDNFKKAMMASLEFEINNLSIAMNKSSESFCREQHKLWYGENDMFQSWGKPFTVYVCEDLFRQIKNIRTMIKDGEKISNKTLDDISKNLSRLEMNIGLKSVTSLIEENIDELIRSVLKILNFIRESTGKSRKLSPIIKQLIED